MLASSGWRRCRAKRNWPDEEELLRLFATYGHSHAVWDDRLGYTEGSLARVVEAAARHVIVLPSVKG